MNKAGKRQPSQWGTLTAKQAATAQLRTHNLFFLYYLPPVIRWLKLPSQPNICRGGGQEFLVCFIPGMAGKRRICITILQYFMSCPSTHAKFKSISTSGKVCFTSGTKCFKAAISSAFSSSPDFLLNTHGRMEEARAQISLLRVDFEWIAKSHALQASASADRHTQKHCCHKIAAAAVKVWSHKLLKSPAPLKPVGAEGVLYLWELRF